MMEEEIDWFSERERERDNTKNVTELRIERMIEREAKKEW